MHTEVATTLALKEWAAAVHALLDGRQTLLLRKGGIHEKAFTIPAGAAPADSSGAFVLFPTVAHSHAERVRPEHRDVLELGAGDVDEAAGTFTVRCGVTIAGVVEVGHPERLPAISDLHIWTAESIQTDRVDFRPVKPLQILVVRAFALPSPVTLPRTEEHAGCKSWLDLPLPWHGEGRQVHAEQRIAGDLERVRAEVG